MTQREIGYIREGFNRDLDHIETFIDRYSWRYRIRVEVEDSGQSIGILFMGHWNTLKELKELNKKYELGEDFQDIDKKARKLKSMLKEQLKDILIYPELRQFYGHTL